MFLNIYSKRKEILLIIWSFRWTSCQQSLHDQPLLDSFWDIII